MINYRSFIFILILFIALTGCAEKQNKTEIAEKEVSKIKAGELTLNNPWVRLAGKNRNTAMFVEIINNTPNNDTLVSVESDAAKLVEIHETYKRDNDMMGMRQVPFVAIASGDTVRLKPMSLHVMFIGLNRDLKQDDSVKVKMNFKVNKPIETIAVVKAMQIKPGKMVK